MATFEEQVEGLTGLSIDGSSAPDQDELSQFLKDGVLDVTRRCIQVKPGEATKFTRRSAELTSQGFDSGGAQILSVIRESGTDNDWRNCREVSAGLQGRVVDTESLHFASKFNPAYIIEDDGIINVYPAPGSNPDAYKVFYVNASPIDGDGNSLTYADSTLGSFPNDKVYLVVIYAAIKALQNALSAVNISTFSLSGSTTAPSNPSIGTVSYTDATNADASASAVSPITVATVAKADISGDVPTYTAPVVTGDTQEITGTIVAGTPGTAADFLNFQHWYDILADLIETEEDTELAQAQISKIQSYIQAYNAAMQNQLNIFNKNNARYQANVQAEIAKHNTDLQKAINQAQIDARDAQQEAQQTTDIDKFNKQQDQVLMLQNKAKTMEAIIANNNSIIQDFQAEMQAYSGKVAAQVQTYQQEIAEKSAEYQWQAGRLQDLKQEYNQAFAMMASPQPQQVAEGR